MRGEPRKKEKKKKKVYLSRTLKLTLMYGLKERMVVKRFGERDIGSCAFSSRIRKLRKEKKTEEIKRQPRLIKCSNAATDNS